MRRKADAQTRKIALLGMLFALCCVFSFVETLVSGWLGLPPGVRLGLANVVIMFALFLLNRKSAFALAVLKALFSFLTRGVGSGLLSLCGGLLSLAVLCVLLAVFGRRISWLALSVCGAVAHNAGQLVAASFWLGNQKVFYYFPLLLVSGIVMGVLTALCLRALMPALKRTNFDNEKNK